MTCRACSRPRPTSRPTTSTTGEGTTIAFERAQISALLDRARRRITELDEALERLDAGRYGVCAGCGGPIAPDRLAARPSARTCIDCANRGAI